MRHRQVPAELRHPLFLTGATLYLVAISQKVGGPALRLAWWPPVLRHHLADLLALPLELTVVLWLMRRFYFRQPGFVLPASWIFSTWVVFVVWFEIVWPRYGRGATADPLDALAYGLGGLVFWRWMNRPATT